ncbi:MAG: phosphate ABC transporter substrate-binding protein [candidate division NC10 bacterium]|nr:phosphate ABC transporter substrate-binding protein [candidate division NC10 bacterium]
MRSKWLKLVWGAMVPIWFGSAVALAAQGSVQIKGSDTMVNLGQAWAEAFMKKNPGAMVAVTGGGSGTGIAALINGTCDIAESSRSMKPTEIEQAKAKGMNPKEHIVALDGIAVVVNPKNPVSRLSLEELRGIFMGSITDWNQVGGKPGPIVVLSREVNSGTHIYFKEHILRRGKEKGPEEFAPSALLLPSSQAIADEVAKNVNAIGYYGMGYISPRQKVIAVAKEEQGRYVKPSLEDVRKGRYPISRPLFWYTKGEPKGLVKDLLDFALSKEGQEIVLQMDFVPLK